jgi:hypothetical protein
MKGRDLLKSLQDMNAEELELEVGCFGPNINGRFVLRPLLDTEILTINTTIRETERKIIFLNPTIASFNEVAKRTY